MDLVPDFSRDGNRMVSLVAGAAVDDIAFIIGVGQEPVHDGDG